jgi:zinc protease
MRLALTALCLLAGGLVAADKPSKIFPLTYDQHDFANGLRLVTVPTEYPNVVALYIVVQTGARNEVEPGKSGFAHFFEHMMFRGTKQYPPAKYESIMKDAGAAQNAFTSADLTAYYAVFSKEDLDTMLEVEADRFQNLEYDESVFKTEALAVLGEYNKNSASPTSKINEVMQNTAFDKHTYKHTTMGFLADIQDMPNQFEYSKKFFDRYYRPEYTTVLIVGDVDSQQTRAKVEKYWGKWKRGTYTAPVPAEPPQKGPRTGTVKWASATLPWVAIAFKGPAYTDTEKDSAALDVLSFLAFGESSDLYQRLVIQEQKTDILSASNPDHVDPFLFTIYARVKKPEHVNEVREQILATIANFKDTLVPAARLDPVKRRLRYEFALGMDNSQAIARTLAHYIALRRTPETINRVYDLYAAITPEDIRNVVRKYLVENGRTVVTLTAPKQ